MSWLPPQEPSPPAGTRLCIDFIGAGVRSDRLLIALRQQCSRLVVSRASLRKHERVLLHARMDMQRPCRSNLLSQQGKITHAGLASC